MKLWIKSDFIKHAYALTTDRIGDRGWGGQKQIERSSSKILYWLTLFVENVGDLYYLIFL